MSNYRWSICDPAHPQVIEKGIVQKEEVLQIFEQYPWIEELQKMGDMQEKDIHFSSSVNFENLITKEGIDISIVGDITSYEFYVFYKRVITVKPFLGLGKAVQKEKITDLTGQSKEDVKKILQAFIDEDVAYLSDTGL